MYSMGFLIKNEDFVNFWRLYDELIRWWYDMDKKDCFCIGWKVNDDYRDSSELKIVDNRQLEYVYWVYWRLYGYELEKSLFSYRQKVNQLLTV